MDLFFCLLCAPSSFSPLFPTTSPICLMAIHTDRRRRCRGGAVKTQRFFFLLPNFTFLLFILTSFLPFVPFFPSVCLSMDMRPEVLQHITHCKWLHVIGKTLVFFFFFLWILSSSRAAASFCGHCSGGSGSVDDMAYRWFCAVATRHNILDRIPVEWRPIPRRPPGSVSNTVLDPSSCG